jgi:hypothetical protein
MTMERIWKAAAWSNGGNIPTFPEGTEENHEASRDSWCPGEDQTKNLPTTRLERYNYIDQVGREVPNSAKIQQAIPR